MAAVNLLLIVPARGAHCPLGAASRSGPQALVPRTLNSDKGEEHSLHFTGTCSKDAEHGQRRRALTLVHKDLYRRWTRRRQTSTHCRLQAPVARTLATEKGDQGARIAQWLECRTRDWKIVGSSPCKNGERTIFSRVNFSPVLILISVFVPPLCRYRNT